MSLLIETHIIGAVYISSKVDVTRLIIYLTGRPDIWPMGTLRLCVGWGVGQVEQVGLVGVGEVGFRAGGADKEETHPGIAGGGP